MTYRFDTITGTLERGVLFATLDNPPCNVMTLQVMSDLTELGRKIATDDSVRVLVLQSLDPEFFVVHFDTLVVIQKSIEGLPKRSRELSPLQAMCAVLRDNPKPSLVKIAGRAGGGGSELASSCDMRFGVRGKTLLNQMEVPLGLLPGASGSQNLPRLMGRGRALEVILGGDDLDAETAERWGYLNRIFDTVEEMNSFVDTLAFRIAKWPPHAVALAKESVGNIDLPWRQGLLEEQLLAAHAVRDPATKRLLRKFMELGAHTRDGEACMGALLIKVAEALATESETKNKDHIP
ncbi:enoyl-CoA hydratase/isomerase family protein [Pseudomonas saliphila]|uniref:enoyl-CoA hydratase/isomerase family protein n=1 Tax=Pseudomonas saliphila TaxID=2586906 RepID=UPI001238ED27|nr:enoyl-CoA hydratase/isomerase family protein [Pseudomonas saliphila]